MTFRRTLGTGWMINLALYFVFKISSNYTKTIPKHQVIQTLSAFHERNHVSKQLLTDLNVYWI